MLFRRFPAVFGLPRRRQDAARAWRPNLFCSLTVGRILAIDYGTKRTGIAVSDPLRIIAGGLETVETKGLEAWLARYFAANEVDVIVLGKPMQPNGEPSATWRYVEPLAARLRRAWPEKEVTFYDERFTSVIAHRAMLDGGLGRMARRDRALVDRISATIILEDYMASLSLRSGAPNEQ